MNNLIDERDERTRKRKRIKRKMDSIIGLSYQDKEKQIMSMTANVKSLADNTIRLLDEGYFDSGFVIKKGTLEKFLNGQNQYVRGFELTDDGWSRTDVLNLTPDFKGTVNLGHMDFATFPFIIGEWSKEDLKLVDIENDRKGLDVSLRLDEESIFVQELKRQPFDIGISSEFYYHINEEDTKTLSEMLDEYMPVIDEVFIFAYGLVGECGNVNSSGLELKGAVMSKPINELSVELENIEETLEENTEELGAEEIDITINEEEAQTEEAIEEAIEDSVDEAEEDEVTEEAESDDEDEVEEVVDEDDEEDEIEEVDELTEALSLIKDLNAQVAELSNKLAEKENTIVELKKSNRRKDKKLAMEKEAKAKFLEETKNLSVELFPNELESNEESKQEESAAENERDYIMTGGIANI